MKSIEYIFRVLKYPFKEGLAWLIACFMLLEVPIIFRGNYSNETVFYICSVLSNFLCCYILVLPLYLVRKYKITHIIYYIIVGSFVVTWCIIDAMCSSMHFFFYDDIAAVIKGTNLNEAIEFAEISFSYRTLVIFGITIALSTVSYILINKNNCFRRIFSVGAVFMLMAGVLMVIRNPESFSHSDFAKSMSFNKYKSPKFEDLLTNPSVEIIDSVRPDNIILVLGESLCRSHCSLYGYNKNTNPRLKEMADSGEILVFKEVTAPDTHTAEALSVILTTRKRYFADDTIRYTTMFEALNKSGYKTQWISNCSKYGMADNEILLYPHFCDTTFFSGDAYSGFRKRDLDEKVLPLILNSNIETPQFTLIHLMGCHHHFRDRYPKSRQKFNKADYLDKPEHQRELWMHYDNAVAYNDSVVSEIIKLYKDKETVLFYFPDHGLDFFVTEDDYCYHGHNNPASIATAVEIPLIIYMSESYKEKFPNMKIKLENLSQTHYYTKDIINDIFEIARIKLLSER